MTRGTVLGLWIGLSAVVAAGGATVLAPARALGAVDSREMQAREAFGAGRYQEALDLFVKLYAEKLHPNYLRNIGRCYQNLGDPDKAISSFHEYLRKAKGVRADERAEVEGYIKEMEDLKKERAATAAAAANPPPPPPPRTIEPEPKATSTTATPSTSSSITTAHDPAGTTSPGVTLTQQPQDSGAASEPSSPIYKKWWFWTIVGAVAVGAGLGVAAAAGVFTKTENASCPAGVTCGGR
jgi:hypothetical protein